MVVSLDGVYFLFVAADDVAHSGTVTFGNVFRESGTACRYQTSEAAILPQISYLLDVIRLQADSNNSEGNPRSFVKASWMSGRYHLWWRYFLQFVIGGTICSRRRHPVTNGSLTTRFR